jgi:tripartite-type tricarboxylate transporter receptor subunit TctC
MFTDLTPVALVASSPYVLVVHPSLPATTVSDFIAYAKANPDKLAYGSGGFINYIRPLMFLKTVGITALYVPYKGGGAAMNDLVAGRIQFRFADVGQALPLIRDKRVRPLAFSGLKRAPELPDLPTLAETILPGYELNGNWYGVMAPSKTPNAIVRKLSVEILRSLQDPEMVVHLAQQGQQPFPASPDDFASYLKAELQQSIQVINDNNLKPET